MICAFFIVLLLSSLASGGVFSPPTEQKVHHHPPEDHLLHEGNRLIVVEYDRAGSPTEDPTTEEFHQSVSPLPNLDQGVSTPAGDVVGDENHHRRSAKDVICDAYGQCKQRIAGFVGKTEEKTKEAVESSDGGSTAAKHVSNNITSAVGKAADKVEGAGIAAAQKGKSVKEKVMEKAKDMVTRAKHARDSAEETGEAAAQKVEEKVNHTGKAVKMNLSDVARRVKELADDAAGYVSSPGTYRAAAAAMHLLGFMVAYGSGMWVTFASSHVLAQALPRQQFGMVQSKLYPVYFRVMAYGILAALLGHYCAENRWQKAGRIQCYYLLSSLAFVVANMVFFEPKATKVMFERMKLEKEEGRGRDMSDLTAEPVVLTLGGETVMPLEANGVTPTYAAAGDPGFKKSRIVQLNKQLKSLNNYSSFLNVLTLMALSWHLVHLSRRLLVNA